MSQVLLSATRDSSQHNLTTSTDTAMQRSHICPCAALTALYTEAAPTHSSEQTSALGTAPAPGIYFASDHSEMKNKAVFVHQSLPSIQH